MNFINPLAKIVALAIIGTVLVVSLDPVTALVTLVIELCVLPWMGLSARKLFALLTPLLVALPFAGLATLLYGRDGGAVLVEVGPWIITEQEVILAITIILRLLAIALPSIVLFATTDPTDLADSLAQLWKLPARFTISALAALRTLGLMRQDWRMLALARRARGVGSGTGFVGGIRRLGSQSFSLLALAIRRGSVLAVAMEARGFDAPTKRTWARQAHFKIKDWMFIGGAVMVAVIAVLCSVMLGAWHVFIA